MTQALKCPTIGTECLESIINAEEQGDGLWKKIRKI